MVEISVTKSFKQFPDSYGRTLCSIELKLYLLTNMNSIKIKIVYNVDVFLRLKDVYFKNSQLSDCNIYHLIKLNIVMKVSVSNMKVEFIVENNPESSLKIATLFKRYAEMNRILVIMFCKGVQLIIFNI